MGKIRTCWVLSATLGIPCSRWGAKPFIANPAPFPRDLALRAACAFAPPTESKQPPIHPLHLALQWQRQIDADGGLTQANIAAREGISRARVTQVMNLLRLPGAIQEEVQCPPAPLEIHSFSERRLRGVQACADEESQFRQWRKLIQELRGFPAG